MNNSMISYIYIFILVVFYQQEIILGQNTVVTERVSTYAYYSPFKLNLIVFNII